MRCPLRFFGGASLAVLFAAIASAEPLYTVEGTALARLRTFLTVPTDCAWRIGLAFVMPTAGTSQQVLSSKVACTVWPFCFALYLVFAASLGIRELVAASIAATFAAVAAARLASCAQLQFHVRLLDLLQGWRLPAYLISGTGEVMVALWRQLFTRSGAESLLATVPFDIGDRGDPVEAHRRALATFYTTATPNFVVLGLIDEQGVMLYHQVLPGKVLKMTQRLGARV